MKWIKATIPYLRTPNDDDLRKLDPAHFCAGIRRGTLGGWGAVFKCGQSAEHPLRYCASFGGVNAGDAWAARLSPQQRMEATFFDQNSDAVKGSQHAAVTFYSTYSVWMGSLRLPAGMYKLIPSKSPDGWRLAIAKQDGEWNDARHTRAFLGSVELKKVAPETLRRRAISGFRWGLGLRDP